VIWTEHEEVARNHYQSLNLNVILPYRIKPQTNVSIQYLTTEHNYFGHFSL